MTPVFTLDPAGRWTPGPYARGPFEGIQGGAVAALMAAATAASGDGFVASLTTHFLKPVPLAPLTVSVRPLRKGRRVSVIDAELFGPSGVVAVQRATLITEQSARGLPEPPPRCAQPETLTLTRREAPHGGAWMMDTLEVRTGPDGTMWFRQERPLFEGATALASLLVAADWAHGLHPPLGAAVRPAAAIPNADLTVHLIRPPSGSWIGVEAQTAWSTRSIGAGWAALYDVEGLIGRVGMSVAISAPQEEVACAN